MSERSYGFGVSCEGNIVWLDRYIEPPEENPPDYFNAQREYAALWDGFIHTRAR